MFLSTILILLLGNISLKNRRIMQYTFDVHSFRGLKNLLLKAAYFVLAIEFIVALLLTISFLKFFSFLKAL